MRIGDICSNNPPSVATIGFFDGVHRGHRFLIDQVRREAAGRGLESAVITFPVHPRQVLQSDYRPKLLTTPQEKLSLLEETGIDTCILLDFTPHLASLTAREFMEVLKNRYNIRALVIGYDHRFGHAARALRTTHAMAGSWALMCCLPRRLRPTATRSVPPWSAACSWRAMPHKPPRVWVIRIS